MRRLLWLLPLLFITQAHAQTKYLTDLSPAHGGGALQSTDTTWWCDNPLGCSSSPSQPLTRATLTQIANYVVGLLPPSGGGITNLVGDVVTGFGGGSQVATVMQLQSRPMVATAPTTGQVLAWSGSAWQPTTPTGGGITIPSASLINGNGTTLGSVALGTNLSLSGTFPSQTLNATGGGTTIPTANLTSGNGSTLGSVTLGSNLSFTGTFPNQTLNATGGGGGSPGGSSGQAQFNNAAAFGGSSGMTMNTTKILSMSLALGSDATGDIYYNSGSGNHARLGIGTAGQVLEVVSGLPAWQTIATGGGTVGSGTGPQIAQYPSGTSTVIGGVTVSGDATLAAGGALTINSQAVTNAKMLQMAANTVKGNFTGAPATPTDNPMPPCADTGGNHLNYVSSTGITCGTSSSGGGGGTAVQSYGVFGGAVNVYTMASPTPAISSNVAGYRVCGFFPSSLAMNTGTATFAAGSAAALPIRVKSAVSGIIALAGGEIQPGTGGNPICLQLDSSASNWVMDSQAPGSLKDVGAGTTTISQADWAAQNVFTGRVAGTTFNLPASAGLSSQAGVTMIVGNNVVAQLCATGSDTINGGAAAGCVSMGYGGLFAVSMPTPGAFFVPLSPDKKRPSISWAPGMNLSNVSIPMFHIDNNSTAVTATCRVEAAVGGPATVQLWAAPSGTACGSGTHIETTACNANGAPLTSQTLGITNAAITGPADICAVFPTGAGWSSSSGAGSIQVNLTTP